MALNPETLVITQRYVGHDASTAIGERVYSFRGIEFMVPVTTSLGPLLTTVRTDLDAAMAATQAQIDAATAAGNTAVVADRTAYLTQLQALSAKLTALGF